jgi:hypothetical protein
MVKTAAAEYVLIPIDVFAQADSIEELEDWLIANNQDLINKLLEARGQHLRGEGIPAEELREELGL